MAFMQITVLPMGTKNTGVSDYIADIHECLQNKEIAYELNDMATIINGTPAELFTIAEELHNLPFQHGAKRVISQIVIDERRDKDAGLGEKKKSVMDILAKRVG